MLHVIVDKLTHCCTLLIVLNSYAQIICSMNIFKLVTLCHYIDEYDVIDKSEWIVAFDESTDAIDEDMDEDEEMTK